jgi:hypothetical protein
MSLTRRAALTAGAAIGTVFLTAAPGLAHQCVNPDKSERRTFAAGD